MPVPPEPPHHASAAFSLLELTLAISVIAAVTLLALGGMRSLSAKSATMQCLSNLKTLHTGAMAYAGDHQGEMPVDRENLSTGSSWYMALAKGYVPHPGWRKTRSPYICPAPGFDIRSSGNAGWTNYAINSNLYDGGTNLGASPSPSAPLLTAAFLAGRRAPRLASIPGNKVFLLDSRNATNGTWYGTAGARWERGWGNHYPVHGNSLNVIFVAGHAETITVMPRTISDDGSLNELKADWFWPVR